MGECRCAHLKLHLQIQQIDFRLLRQDIPQRVFPFHRMVYYVLEQRPQIYPGKGTMDMG